MRNAGHFTRGTPRAFPVQPEEDPGWHARLQKMLRNSTWYLRLPLWLYLAYVGVRQFFQPVDYSSLFAPINMCIHEGGHVLFHVFPDFIHVAAGTLAQLAAPVAAAVILAKQRDPFGMTVCLGWLSTNFVGVGVYMADARARELPLVTAEGIGSTKATIHDWEYLFGQLGLLPYDTAIGLFMRTVGSALMLLALASGAWIMWEMAKVNRTPTRRADL